MVSDDLYVLSWICSLPVCKIDEYIPNTSFVGPDSVERIDREIRELEGTIRALKQERNAYCSVNRLPIELLGSILEQTLPQLGVPDAVTAIQASVRLSHVCEHWRRTTLARTTMWSSVSLNPETLSIDEILIRSQGSPLRIYLPLSSHEDVIVQPLLSKIFSQFYRVESLFMTGMLNQLTWLDSHLVHLLLV
jgi:hypothetical protein